MRLADVNNDTQRRPHPNVARFIKGPRIMCIQSHIIHLVSTMNAAANALESTMRKGAEDQAHIATDVANPASNPEKYADPSGEKMKALAWQGANDVQMG